MKIMNEVGDEKSKSELIYLMLSHLFASGLKEIIINEKREARLNISKKALITDRTISLFLFLNALNISKIEKMKFIELMILLQNIVFECDDNMIGPSIKRKMTSHNRIYFTK